MHSTHIPPGIIQSHSDIPQTPPRHLPDTLQTPQNIAHFDQSKATRGKKEQTNKKCLIGCLSIACTPYPPDNIQIHSDNHQAPLRHIPDNLQTFWGNWERRNQLIKITLIRFLLSINFTPSLPPPHTHTHPHPTPESNQSHSDSPRHFSEVTSQTPYRHRNIGHSMANPGSLREKEPANKKQYSFNGVLPIDLA